MVRFKLILLFLALIALPTIAQAQTYTANNWIATVPGSDFSSGSNWSLGYFPRAGTTAPIQIALMQNGVEADVLTAPPNSMGQLWLGSNAGSATLNMSSSSLTVADWLIVGQGYTGNTLSPVTGGTGTINLSGSAILNQTTTGEFHIGEGSNTAGDPITTGTVTVSGSATINETGGDVEIGYQRNGNGTLTVSENATFNFKPSPSAKWFFIGRYLGGTGGIAPSGTMTVKGNATFTVQGSGDTRFLVGADGAGTTGTLNIQENAVVNLQGWTYLGWFGGTGTVNQSGGTVTYNGLGYLCIGGFGGGTNGTWNQTGGTFNSTVSPVVLTDGANATGTYYLSGGTLYTKGIQMGTVGDSASGSVGNFYFNGGTLKASASSANFIYQNSSNGAGAINVYVSFGGAKIDTNGYDIRFAAPLILNEDPVSTGGSLTKLGSGTLTIDYPTYFTGNTYVNAGTLIMDQTSSPITTVASGATLGGSCQFNGLVVNAPNAGVRGTLSPGVAGTYSGAGAMQGKNLTMTAAQLNFDIGTTSGSDQIALTGNLSASSSEGLGNLFNFTSGTATTATTYQLITFSTFNTGSLADFSMTDDSVGSYTATLQQSANSIDLVLSAANEWKGTTSTYNLGGNWLTGAVPKNLGDRAVFALLGSTGNVDLNISPTLGKIIFNNSSRNYVIGTSSSQSITLNTAVLAGPKVMDNAGSHEIQVNMTMARDSEFSVAQSGDVLTISGAIGGAGRVLTMSGSGTLLLSGANSYSGATVINSGILQANTLAPAGSNCSIGSGSDLTINGGTFQYTGADAIIDRNLNVGANATIDTANNITISGTISAASSAVFTKIGAGLLKYTNGGTNTIASGTGGVYFVSNGSVEFAGNSGSVYNVNSGALLVGFGGGITGDFKLTSGTINVGENFTVGSNPNPGTGTATGTATIAGGQLNVNGETWIGSDGNGTLTMTGGTLALNESWFEVGRGTAGGLATFNFSGGSVVKPSSNIAGVVVGWCPASSGTHAIYMSGNALFDLPGGEFWIGNDSGNAGQMTMGGNATINIASWFCVGRNFATGSLTMNGGTINKSGLNYIVVGSLSATGTVYQNAGTVNNPAILYLGEATGTGTYYLNGGLLQAAQVVSGTTTNPGAATGNLYLNGGILQASAASTDFMTVNGSATLNVLIQSAGAKIDTNGFDVTINKILAFDPASTGGGLTKQGSGTLTITQNATYTGNTTASAGILDMLDIATPTANVTVGSGAALTARSVVCNTITLGAGSTLTIMALPGGPTAALSISPVPEPGTLVLLAMAGLAMIFAKWRKIRP